MILIHSGEQAMYNWGIPEYPRIPRYAYTYIIWVEVWNINLIFPYIGNVIICHHPN